MRSSNLPVEDASEEFEDFKVPFKASALRDMVAPVIWEADRPIVRVFGGYGCLQFAQGETDRQQSCSPHPLSRNKRFAVLFPLEKPPT